ncbi:MAG: HEAT repeat domain-containing protein [Verrucomicrobiae bacterium]|nr:HEAT repeat domain-containing protein [Verrucomicrobiae bacterium]MCP5541174.1 HEAT repeat domain-containing protein [Akkermansiaceae bacterium]MCP5550486.1 HEAT repeat domain-containing protein [Akkermansiaceae bacterium]
MKSLKLPFIFLGIGVVLVTALFAMLTVGPGTGGGSSAGSAGGGAATTMKSPPPGEREKATKSGWVPPEGDPVERFNALANGTPKERKDLISNFMALGHERNPDMLIAALKDPDTDVRVFAVESASALTEEESERVLHEAIVNDNADARDMAWSLSAPRRPEARASLLGSAIMKGSNVALEEAFNELVISIERPFFEIALTLGLNEATPPERDARLLKELQSWLEPGGGDIPTFGSLDELNNWWRAQQENYDEFMLRID